MSREDEQRQQDDRESAHRRLAEAYLREVLGGRSFGSLVWAGSFDEQPLETEGGVSLFRFSAAMDGESVGDYWVVAGETKPNYYPDFGLSLEQMYCLHIGTRFMLELEIPVVPVERWPENWRASVVSFASGALPGAEVRDPEPAAGFQLEGGVYVVCRVRVGGESVYVLGLDCPPAIYREAHLPPHVIFRLHLGQLIRAEADRERAAERIYRANRERGGEL